MSVPNNFNNQGNGNYKNLPNNYSPNYNYKADNNFNDNENNMNYNNNNINNNPNNEIQNGYINNIQPYQIPYSQYNDVFQNYLIQIPNNNILQNQINNQNQLSYNNQEINYIPVNNIQEPNVINNYAIPIYYLRNNYYRIISLNSEHLHRPNNIRKNINSYKEPFYNRPSKLLPEETNFTFQYPTYFRVIGPITTIIDFTKIKDYKDVYKEMLDRQKMKRRLVSELYSKEGDRNYPDKPEPKYNRNKPNPSKDEKINEILEDMCIYGNIAKMEIKEEKEKAIQNPEVHPKNIFQKKLL